MTARLKAFLRKWLVIILGIVVSAAILYFLVTKNLAAVRRVGDDIRWGWVVCAAFSAMGSYVMVGLALDEVLALLGYQLSVPEALGIAFVSTTANYFISTAGMSGFALKAHLLRKRKIPYGITVTASVLSSAILYMVLAVIIAQGFLYLVMHMRGAKIMIMESAAGLLVLSAITVPLLVFFFSRRVRGTVTRRVFHWANRGLFLFSRSEIPKEDFHEFETQLASGLACVRHNKGRLAKTILFTGIDWTLCMSALYLGFRAVGVSLPVGHLTAGFTVGMAATFIPILPGGLGAVEGSMVAIFVGLGIDWDKALVASLLYRLTYYLIPGLMSVFVLWGLKVSEPALIEETVREAATEEINQLQAHAQRQESAP